VIGSFFLAASSLSICSAIGDRHMFPVHTKTTLKDVLATAIF